MFFGLINVLCANYLTKWLPCCQKICRHGLFMVLKIGLSMWRKMSWVSGTVEHFEDNYECRRILERTMRLTQVRTQMQRAYSSATREVGYFASSSMARGMRTSTSGTVPEHLVWRQVYGGPWPIAHWCAERTCYWSKAGWTICSFELRIEK